MKTRISLLLALFGCCVQSLVAAEALGVSLIQLIANPKEYDGKVVQVIGFVRLEFEGNAIYLHQDDYKHGITKNGLWLDVTEDIRKRTTEFDQKYVIVVGTFSAKDTGHFGMWSGSIRKISRFDVWIDGRK